jgi:hypothetical protein
LLAAQKINAVAVSLAILLAAPALADPIGRERIKVVDGDSIRVDVSRPLTHRTRRTQQLQIQGHS